MVIIISWYICQGTYFLIISETSNTNDLLSQKSQNKICFSHWQTCITASIKYGCCICIFALQLSWQMIKCLWLWSFSRVVNQCFGHLTTFPTHESSTVTSLHGLYLVSEATRSLMIFKAVLFAVCSPRMQICGAISHTFV